MKFQIVSDLHLDDERCKHASITRKCDNIILLGDIAEVQSPIYFTFLTEMCTLFSHVFIVLGNHEYFGSSINETVEKVREWCVNRNAILLHDSTYDINGIRFIGTTLWSNIKPKYEKYTEKYIKDYKNISLLTPKDTTNIHKVAVKWLQSEIDRATKDGVKLCICTHHAPLINGTSQPCFDDDSDIRKCSFKSDQSSLMGGVVKYWMFGHTHHTCDFYYNDTRIISNAHGYNMEKTLCEDVVYEVI